MYEFTKLKEELDELRKNIIEKTNNEINKCDELIRMLNKNKSRVVVDRFKEDGKSRKKIKTEE